MRRLAQALLATSGVFILMAGVTLVFLSSDGRKSGSRRGNRPPSKPAPELNAQPNRSDYFEIRRTQSELGYTYWILKGHGVYQCFELFDSWREAMSEAQLHTERAPALQYH